MITVHSGWADDFSSLGLCPLTPVECTVEEQAGGIFQLKMAHPMDETRKWWNLQKWNIIKAPAPMRETPLLNISAAGQSVTREIYRVNVNTRLRLRTKPSTSTGKIVGRYKSGTKVIRIGTSGSWYQVIVKDGGATGWMHSDYLDYVGTETQAPAQSDRPAAIVQARQTREQLFRIVTVDRDDAAQLVYVTALHVFYDLTGNVIVGTYSPEDAVASEVARAIFENTVKPHNFEIYADASDKVTGTYSGRNIVSALTEKDGILHQANARLVRDNFDVFVLEDEERDRGVEIRHGKNMLGAVMTEDVSDVITTVIPVGKDEQGEPLYIDNVFVDAENAEDIPMPRAKEIQYDVKVGSDEFPDNKTARQELERLARAEFAENGINHGAIGLDVDFVALENTRQYAQYAALQSVHLYDTVRVISARSGIDARARVTGYVYNCLTRRYDTVTLGDLFALETTVSGYDIAPNTVSGNRLVQGSVDGSALRSKSIQYAQIAQATINQLNAAAIAAVSGRFDEIIAGSLTADKLYATVAEIIELRFGQISGETVDTDKLYADIAEIIELRTKEIVAENIDTDTLAAEYARIMALIVDRIDAGDIQTDKLGAALAEFVSMYAQTGEFDFATVQNLVSKALSLQQGAMDEVYINNLAVTSANLLSATLGKLVIKGDDGKYYRVLVGGDGKISAEEVDDVYAEVMGGKQVVETSMNVGSLNASNLQASSAVINSILTTALTAGSITAADAVIASATIPALYTSTIEAIENSLLLTAKGQQREAAIRLMQEEISLRVTEKTFSAVAEGLSERIGQNSSSITQLSDKIESKVESTTFNTVMGAYGDAISENADAIGTLNTKVSENTSQITQLSDKIESKVESTTFAAVADILDGNISKNADAIGTLNTKVSENTSQITQLSTEISSKVSAKQFNEKTGAMDETVSQLTQRADGLEATLDKKVDGETLRSYIRYDGSNVEIGRSDSRYISRTSNEGFVVLQDGAEMTSMKKNTVSAPVIEAKRQFAVGSFVLRKGADGGLLIL